MSQYYEFVKVSAGQPWQFDTGSHLLSLEPDPAWSPMMVFCEQGEPVNPRITYYTLRPVPVAPAGEHPHTVSLPMTRKEVESWLKSEWPAYEDHEIRACSIQLYDHLSTLSAPPSPISREQQEGSFAEWVVTNKWRFDPMNNRWSKLAFNRFEYLTPVELYQLFLTSHKAEKDNK